MMDSIMENGDGTDGSSLSNKRKMLYRKFLEKAELIEERKEFNVDTAEEIGEILNRANVIGEEVPIKDRVEFVEETLLELQVISSASGLLKKCIEKINFSTTIEYNSKDFAENLILYTSSYGQDEIDFAVLLEEANLIIPQCPQYKSGIVVYDLNKSSQAKLSKTRRPREIEHFTKQELERVTEIPKDEEGIDNILKNMHTILSETYNETDESIPYYDFVIDTESFSNTIENMFYFAFLVRNSLVQLEFDAHGSPFIIPLEDQDDESSKKSKNENTQIISSISMEEWKKHKKPGLLQQHKLTT